MKTFLQSLLYRLGYKLVKKSYLNHPDITENDFWEIYTLCKPYTMTSIERMYSLYSATNYVLDNHINGDFVECGVWRGGSAMMVAQILKKRNIINRKIYLYDTFEGMTQPSSVDESFNGEKASLQFYKKKDKNGKIDWCYADLDDVKNNMSLTGFSLDNIQFIKGKVEDTLPAYTPSSISLLRLDTDWYESTIHELNVLYPLLERLGVLIIDDYGHWKGSRKAVDEYFAKIKFSPLLNRVDYSARLLLKLN